MLFVLVLIATCYGTHLAVGISQQHIYQSTSPDGDRFHYTLWLTTVASFVNSFVGLFALWAANGFNFSKVLQTLCLKGTIRKDYILVSLTFMAAKVASNHSLTLVDYATQALAKCAKPISVVLLGVCHFGLRFKPSDVVCSLWIVVSLLFFNILADSSKRQAIDTFHGNMLLLFSLICDGLTGARLDTLVLKLRSGDCKGREGRVDHTLQARKTSQLVGKEILSDATPADDVLLKLSPPLTSPAMLEEGLASAKCAASTSGDVGNGVIDGWGRKPNMSQISLIEISASATPLATERGRRASGVNRHSKEFPEHAYYHDDPEACNEAVRLSRRSDENLDYKKDETSSRTSGDAAICASYELMCTINMMTTCCSGLASILFEREQPMLYMNRHPDTFIPLLTFCILGSLGQLCSFKCVSYLGALQTSTITTTRKLVMVLVSVMWFQTHLHWIQWTSVASVATAILWRTSFSYKAPLKTLLRPMMWPMRRRWLFAKFSNYIPVQQKIQEGSRGEDSYCKAATSSDKEMLPEISYMKGTVGFSSTSGVQCHSSPMESAKAITRPGEVSDGDREPSTTTSSLAGTVSPPMCH